MSFVFASMFVVRMFVYVYIRVLCSGKNAVVRSIECSHIVGNFFPFKNESGRTVGCAVVVSLAGSRDRIADARLDTGPARQTGPSTNNLSSYFLGTFGTSGIFIS